MTSYVNVFILYVIIGIPVCVGLCFFQRWLSRMDRRWPGMVLPVMAFALSVVFVLVTTSWDPLGYRIELVGMFLELAGKFLAANIPTLVFLVIYFLCRRGREERTKMDLKDL